MKFISSRSSQKGFTLVELMIVIAIIGILSGIIITSLTGSKTKSRDARRVSDVNQIQLALEQYFDRCGQYPLTLVPNASNGCPTLPSLIMLGSYISVIPKDPSKNTSYDYAINSATYPTDYILHATLEDSNAAQQNSFTPFPNSGWIVVSGPINGCFDSSHLKDYCVSTK